MKNPFITGSGEPENSKSVQLTASMFLGLEGTNGYTTPEEFIAYGEGLKPKEATNINTLLTCMQQSLRMNGNPNIGVDGFGKPYTWHEFYKARAIMSFKIVNGGGLPQLANDYADGKVTIAFTLDEVIALARKS